MRTAFGCEFDVPDGYLNTASIGIPPAPVADAVTAAVRGWRTGRGRPPEFDEPTARARRGFADLVGVPPAWVAIGGAVSALVGLLAASVPDGTRVLVAAGEFTSVTWPFAAQAGRGVTLVQAELDELWSFVGKKTNRQWVWIAMDATTRHVIAFHVGDRSQAGFVPWTIPVVDGLDGREGRALNRRYRGRDYATNVLTFVYDDAVSLTGDIVLCAPVIAKEAREQHKTLRAHYAHLVIHGMLHLQGYDHERDADAARMEAREIALLRDLGFANPYA